ncbi:CRAL/TRIO, N-terminal domain,CRAL-TRIO lipid binding domain [Cinara cedri]|uniref:CRAL/TRIO, N-terminal domain,CRAL-TRIO lipid binding domain n=1 Tax=Cinara cedri TaxID=506608 RepID=A0A5E4M808_9HEMI|nr:CRAL/TRIO, N-terminal domain,CRAL-TRIO lipid binding domain [Cinara cedri]
MYSPTVPFSEYFHGEQLKYPELTQDAIETLKKSLENENLPPITDKKYLAFLHSCYFDLEYAKKTIQKFYGFYSDIPEVFQVLDPLAQEIETNYKCVSIGQMPSVNIDKSERFLFVQLKNYNANLFEYSSIFKYLAMWMDHTLLRYGTCDAIIAVIDSKGLNWRHIIKLPVLLCRQMLLFLETALPIRLKSIHVLNTGSTTQMLMKVIMQFASKELQERIKLYSPGSEEIFSYVPRKVMPVEIGGLGKSHNHYNDELYNHLIDIRPIFLERNEILNKHRMNQN